eukprot:247941_1
MATETEWVYEWLRLSRSNEHIQQWLRVNKLLDDIDENELLIQCMNQMSSIFGGHKRLLYFISRFSDMTQLQNMFKMIKEKKINYAYSKSCTPITKSNQLDLADEIRQMSIDIDLTSEHSNSRKQRKPPFISLPNELISNICEYLNRQEIKRFKLTSKKIGIVCLEQQTKIPVFVFNTNHFIENPEVNLQNTNISKNINIYTKTRSMYSPTRRFFSLFEEWSAKYNIPEQSLLVFHDSITMNGYQTILCNTNDMRSRAITSIKPSIFIIADKRKIVLLNDTVARQLNINDTFESLKNLNFLILEYFNVFKQRTHIAQFILYPQQCITVKGLFHYITNDFLYIDGFNNQWHKQLKMELKQMRSKRESILEIYDCNSRRNGFIKIQNTSMFFNSTFCTFQINLQHEFYQQTDKLKEIKQSKCGFYSNVIDFYKRKITVKVKYTGVIQRLEAKIAKYQSLQQNKIEITKKIKTFMNNIRCLQNVFAFEINDRAWSALVRMRISDLLILKDIVYVDALNIELVEWFHVGYRGCPKLIPWTSTVPMIGRSRYSAIGFDIVNYDVSHIKDNERVYMIRVHQHKDAPYPFWSLIKDYNEIITIKYNKEFTVKNFVQEVLASRDTVDSNERKMNERMLYVLSPYPVSEGVSQSQRGYHIVFENAYPMNSVQRYECNNKTNVQLFDLFMIPTKRSYATSDNKLRLVIKFIVKSETYFPENKSFNAKMNVDLLDNLRFIGIPLIVWIDKNDTLQNVIDQFVHPKARVKYTYRVKTNDKIESIAKGKRNTCCPHRFLQKNPNDYMIIVIQHVPNNFGWIPTFDRWVYKQH